MNDVVAVLDEFLRDSGVPGVAVSLFTADGVVAEAARGVASIEVPDMPMTPVTVGRAYSLSKVMTATALAILAAAGRVDLDESVAGRLPDAPGRDRFAGTTLHHLLTHASGLVHGPVPFSAPLGGRDPIEQYVLGACLGAPRIGEPGQVFGYSDLGLVVAGYLLQRVTRTPFDRAIQRTLFRPAGMARTTMDPLCAMTFPVSQQHLRTNTGSLQVRRRFGFHPATTPSTGAFTCVADLARLGRLHLGPSPLLGAELVGQLTAPIVDVGLDIVRDYGLTLARGPRYGRAMGAGHEGYDEGGWVKLMVVPELGVGVAWLDNQGDADDLRPLRQECFDHLLHLLGAGPRSWRRDDEADDGQDPPCSAGRYHRPGKPPITVESRPDGLRASDGAITVDYRYRGGRLFTAPDAALPMPWAPDRDSDRSALSVVGPAAAPTHILVNGLPYQRCGDQVTACSGRTEAKKAAAAAVR
jgi:CubicO group peptidase (beta-lactamase class C family)